MPSNPFDFFFSFLDPKYKIRKKQSKQIDNGMNSDLDESRGEEYSLVSHTHFKTEIFGVVSSPPQFPEMVKSKYFAPKL
jgi:hypothetical protein